MEIYHYSSVSFAMMASYAVFEGECKFVTEPGVKKRERRRTIPACRSNAHIRAALRTTTQTQCAAVADICHCLLALQGCGPCKVIQKPRRMMRECRGGCLLLFFTDSTAERLFSDYRPH